MAHDYRTSASSPDRDEFHGRPSPSWRRTCLYVLAGLAAVSVTGVARGGAVLVSRDSYIRATGVTSPDPSGKFDLSDGTNGFGWFANDVSNGDAPGVGAVSEAHQYSAPGVDSSANAFQGAFAEGSVRADIKKASASASAQSYFDLTFRVVGGKTNFEFGAAMGTLGGGGVTAELLNVTSTVVPGGPSIARLSPSDLTPVPIFSTELLPGRGDSATLDKLGTLDPGTYTLHLRADSSGSVGENSAYYSVNLTLTPASNLGSSGAVAVPLPPGVLPGLIGLVGVVSGAVWRRRRLAA